MMGHVFLAGLASLLVVVSGQDPPKKCCLDKQYSAQMTDMSSISSNNMNVMLLEMDFEARKQAMQNYTFNPITKHITNLSKTVSDFAKSVVYYMPAADPTQCYKVKNEMKPVLCIPDDAQYMGSSYLGLMASHLDYDGWRFQMPGSQITVTIAVTRKGCVPILEGMTSPNNPAEDRQFLFNAYTAEISDKSLFDLPDSCFN